jgi:hypothetical protein
MPEIQGHHPLLQWHRMRRFIALSHGSIPALSGSCALFISEDNDGGYTDDDDDVVIVQKRQRIVENDDKQQQNISCHYPYRPRIVSNRPASRPRATCTGNSTCGCNTMRPWRRQRRRHHRHHCRRPLLLILRHPSCVSIPLYLPSTSLSSLKTSCEQPVTFRTNNQATITMNHLVIDNYRPIRPPFWLGPASRKQALKAARSQASRFHCSRFLRH